ncbi:MAG: RnfABCDGE type electron transport complex subunit B [Arsenophonus sp.]
MVKITELFNVKAQSFDENQLILKKKVAFIDEANCIGCTKCIQACPVDAIIGTKRSMHTIVKELCTGCEFCIIPCPTDSISMLLIKNTSRKN